MVLVVSSMMFTKSVFKIKDSYKLKLVGIFTRWITNPLAFVCDILQYFFEILLGIGCEAKDLLENMVKGQSLEMIFFYVRSEAFTVS